MSNTTIFGRGLTQRSLMDATEFDCCRTCKHGCKVMLCKCGYLFVFHSKSYGHKDFFIEHSSTGNGCTCKNGEK